MSYLIEHDGEKVWTKDLEGYEGCKVLHEGKACKPREHCVLKDGKWVLCKETKEKAERRAKFRAMDRDELVDHILSEIDARLK